MHKIFSNDLYRWCKWFVSGNINDRVVITGYIRRTAVKYKMDRDFPTDLIGILRDFYCNETLHCVHCVGVYYPRKDVEFCHDMIPISNQRD